MQSEPCEPLATRRYRFARRMSLSDAGSLPGRDLARGTRVGSRSGTCEWFPAPVAKMSESGSSEADGRGGLSTPEEIAELLRVPVQLLYRWRYERKGPPSFRIGRYVRYRRADVEQWIDRQAAGEASVR
ncbi:MAG: helix-turn-helix domain-containing protein [Acidimicrobiia bacterium]